MAKATTLIKAYMTETIPSDGGFIVTAFFSPGTNYAIYEVTAYRNVKDIFKTNDGLTFKTDGNRTHMLVEPASYIKKYIEPVNREEGKSIPYRFADMDILEPENNMKIMIPLEPIMLYSTFTILEKEGDYFSYVFHPTSDVYVAMRKFIADSLYNDCNVPSRNAKEIGARLLETIKKFSIFSG